MAEITPSGSTPLATLAGAAKHEAPLITTPDRHVETIDPQPGAGRRMSDASTELIISWLLRIGVWTSIAVISLGLLMLVFTDSGPVLHSHAGGLESVLTHPLKGQPGVIASYGSEATSVKEGQAFGVIMLGLLILLATPVLRVAVSIIAFLIEGDRLYAVITAVVLALLMVGIFLGKAGG